MQDRSSGMLLSACPFRVSRVVAGVSSGGEEHLQARLRLPAGCIADDLTSDRS